MKKRTKNKQFINGFTIIMFIFSILFAFPTIIEGINVKVNYQSYIGSNENIAPGSYKVVKFDLKNSYRFKLIVRGENSTGTNSTSNGDHYYLDYNQVPVVFALLAENEFLDWHNSGENIPNIINSTYSYTGEFINLENIGIKEESDYYFIFFNANPYAIDIHIDLQITPWGHILATSIVGFGFSICFLALLTKIGFTIFYTVYTKDKPKILTVQSQGKTEAVLQPEKEESFCVSCGAPTTKKDGRYCPNCGSST